LKTNQEIEELYGETNIMRFLKQYARKGWTFVEVRLCASQDGNRT